MKRVILIILDSVGIGAMEDAGEYGDWGTNTLRSVFHSPRFHVPNMRQLGLFNIDGIDYAEGIAAPPGAYARMKEASKGKDTTIGHWEIAGLVSQKPLPVFPDGFPKEVMDAFCRMTGRGYLCNRPYSGTEVIKDFGEEHLRTGSLIVYTSADSVFQIAAHEDIVSLEELYRYCRDARCLLTGEYGVGRVIARPFGGHGGTFKRTAGRHDFSLEPQGPTMLEALQGAGLEVIGVGKINDIFAGKGITAYTYTSDNSEGIAKTLAYMDSDFTGLLFTNLVDYDMLYGHRNDVDGYAEALSYFDAQLPAILSRLKDEDLLLITADHGCDPGYTASTDHSREYVPLLMAGKAGAGKGNLGTRETFADIGATILAYFDIKGQISGTSLL